MNTCDCGRTTRDDAYVCDACADELAKALGDVPALTEELEVTIAKRRGIDYRTVGGSKGGKKPTEMPPPGNMGAADALRHLKALLVSWALFCEAENVRNSDPRTDPLGEGDDTTVALSRWLLWRVDGLTLHDQGGEAVDQITSAVAHCQRVIDRPADRQFLGACDLCQNGRLYAAPHSDRAVCDQCESGRDANQLRANLLSELDDRLCTASEIARLSTYLGLRADRDQVRKRINQWHARGILAQAHAFSDEPTFRFGDVYARLVATEYGTTRAG